MGYLKLVISGLMFSAFAMASIRLSPVLEIQGKRQELPILVLNEKHSGTVTEGAYTVRATVHKRGKRYQVRAEIFKVEGNRERLVASPVIVARRNGAAEVVQSLGADSKIYLRIAPSRTP